MLSFVALALAFGTSRASPQTTPPPRTYVSPSGRWILTVEPTATDLSKDADYVMTEGSHEAWHRRLPFALRDASVTDDGRVTGIAYSGAILPVYPGPYGDSSRGETLHVVLLSSEGAVLLDEKHERVESAFMHADPNPIAEGLFILPELERFVVRIADEDVNRGAEEWWGYDLEMGRLLFRERPKLKLGLEESIRSITAARPVPGTPLVLVHWWRCEDSRRSLQALGGVFQLIDSDWNVVWKLELFRDYEVAESQAAQHRLQNEIRVGGAILATAPGCFDLRLVASGQHALFAVERTAAGWKITELERRPYHPENRQAPR